MIIVCPSCGKNFNVRDDQIPDKGRLLQCSSCKHEWFFTKNTIPINDNMDEISNDEFTQDSFGILDEEDDQRDKEIAEDKRVKSENQKNKRLQRCLQINRD